MHLTFSCEDTGGRLRGKRKRPAEAGLAVRGQLSETECTRRSVVNRIDACGDDGNARDAKI
jgi:hypothetical protein